MINERIATPENLKRQARKRHAECSNKWYWRNQPAIRKHRAKYKGPRACQFCNRSIEHVLPRHRMFCNAKCKSAHDKKRKKEWRKEKREVKEAEKLSSL